MPYDPYSLANFGRPAAPAAPSRSTLETALDWLDKPGQLVRGAIKGGYDPNQSAVGGAWNAVTGKKKVYGTDLLKDAGMGEGWGRSALGFGVDILTDPLTFLPTGALTKGAKLVGKGVGAGAKLGLKAAETVAPKATSAAKTVASVAKEGIGKTFIPGFGLEEGYRDMRRLHDAFQRTNAENVAERIVEVSKGYEPTVRRAALIWMEKGGRTVPEVVELATKYQDILKDVFKREAGVGLQDVGKEIQQYAPRVFGKRLKEGNLFEGYGRTVSAKNPFANKRELASIDEALKAGAEPDAALAVNARLRVGEKSIRSAQFLRDVATTYGKKADRIVKDGVEMGLNKKSIPPGFRAVFSSKDNPLADSRFFQQVITLADGTQAKLRDIALPEKIADDLYKTFLKGARAKGAGMQMASDALQGVNKMFRAGATYLRPGFHLTNLQGNLWNMNLGGMDPIKGIIGTAKQAKGLWKGASVIPDRVGKYTRDEVLAGIQKFNISSPQSTFAGMDDLVGMPDKILEALDGVQKRGFIKKYSDFMRKAGSSIEGGSKEALFLQELGKGKSMDEAAKTVNKFLFDYADLTNTERSIRNWLPFYTWSRKNVPLQAEMLLAKPHVYGAIGKGKHALESVNSKEQVPEAYRPEYLRQEAAVQLPWNKKGGATYWQHYLPFKDLNLIPLTPGDVGRAAQDVGSMLGPMAKIPLEAYFNRNMLNRRPLYNEDLGYFGDVRPSPSMAGFPLPVALQHLVSSVNPALPYAGKVGQGVVNLAAGDRAAGLGQLMSALGLRATVKSAADVKRDRTYAKSDIKTAAGRKKKQAKELQKFRETAAQRAKRLAAEIGLD